MKGRSPSSEQASRKAADSQQAADTVRRALHSMHGHATFAFLNDIYRVACEFGFDGSIDDVLCVLSKMSDVRVEQGHRGAEARVVHVRRSENTGHNV